MTSYQDFDVISTGTAATSGGPYDMGSQTVDANSAYVQVSEAKECSKKCEEKSPDRQRGEFLVAVHRSPKGHRVKLVGGDLDELAQIFIDWADRLDKDLRVVLTNGMAPYEFYERPLVDMRVGPNTLVLFLTGDPKAVEKSEGNPDKNTWRVGLDELQSRKAPAKLESPEFPAYANIHDDRKTFIGRVEGKYIYTMLYVPTVEKKMPDLVVGGKITMKERHQIVASPATVAPLVEHVLEKYRQIVQRYSREVKGEVTDASFREFCGDSMRKRQKSLQEKIDQAMSDIRYLEKSLIEKSRSVRESQKEITLLGSGALDTELAKEVRMLHKLVDDGLYEKFKIRHGRIIGMSAPVTIEHEGKKYALGKFLVCIRQNGAIELRHETKTGASHPHLSTGSEHPCLGNMGSDVPKLIGMERYAMVFQIMHEWLYCYNVSSRHNRIEDCVRERADVKLTGGEPLASPGVTATLVPGVTATLVPGVTATLVPGPIPAGPTTPGEFVDLEAGVSDLRQKMDHVKTWVAEVMGVPREALRDAPEARKATAEEAMRTAGSETVKKYQAFTANVSEIEEVG